MKSKAHCQMRLVLSDIIFDKIGMEMQGVLS